MNIKSSMSDLAGHAEEKEFHTVVSKIRSFIRLAKTIKSCSSARLAFDVSDRRARARTGAGRWVRATSLEPPDFYRTLVEVCGRSLEVRD